MPRRIVCLLAKNSDWNSAQQMALVVRGLSQQGNLVTACVWNGARAFPHDPHFRRGGEYFDLNAAKRLDLEKLAILARKIRSCDPEVVHIWGIDRGLCLLGRCFTRGAAFVRTCLPESNAVSSRLPPGLLHNWVDVNWLPGRDASSVVSISPCVSVPTSSSYKSRSDILANLNLPIDAVLIGTTSGGTAHLRDLVWAMQLLQASNEKIHLLVWAPRWEHECLRRQCHAWGVDGHLHFLDPGSRAGCLSHLDVYWAGQSDWTGILESMTAATPVVEVSNSSHQNIVEDGVSGFLYPNANVGILARRSHLLLTDSERRQRMGEAARRQVRDHYSVDQTVRRYQALYDELIERQAARGKTIDKFAPLAR